MTHGLQPGQMIVVAGRPAMGKSTLGMDFARNAAIHDDQCTVVFSLEMSREEIAQRLFSAETNIPLNVFRDPSQMTDERWRTVNGFWQKLEDKPLYIDDSANLKVPDIRAKCRRLKETKDLKLVVVDYLQLMSSGRMTENRQQEVSDFSRQFKLLAKELQVPVVILSQLNRNVEMRADKVPQMSDLRESGSIEQDADVVFLVHRPDAYDKEDRPGEADIIMAKHRNGRPRLSTLLSLEATASSRTCRRAIRPESDLQENRKKQIMGEKITAKVETITPEIAKTMLGENVNNRRISRDNVNLFAREIRNGEWRFNGEAIKFGKDGRLLDGQHRLLAVIAADKPLTTLVIRGLEDETQQTMDSGKTRTLGDVLTLRGEKNSTQLASLARAVYLADQLGMEAAAQNDLKPTRGEIISFIDQTPQLADVLAASRAFRSQSGDMLTSSMFASLWWTFAHIDTDAANRFFMSLASGANLQADDPILILRNTLMAQPHKAGRSTRDNRVRIAALTIKAWNKWRKGKPLRQLKFSAGESFPTPR